MRTLFKLGAVALAAGLAALHAQTEFDFQTDGANPVNDRNGNPVGNGVLVLLIANESGSTGFNILTPASSLSLGSLLNGTSYQIIGSTNVDEGFGPGQFFGTNTINYTGTYQNLQANDQLAVVWFTTITDPNAALTQNTNYGLYTEGDWVAPASGEISLTVPAGQDASLSAVPEPSTYASLAGGAALLFAFWRRRQVGAA